MNGLMQLGLKNEKEVICLTFLAIEPEKAKKLETSNLDQFLMTLRKLDPSHVSYFKQILERNQDIV